VDAASLVAAMMGGDECAGCRELTRLYRELEARLCALEGVPVGAPRARPVSLPLRWTPSDERPLLTEYFDFRRRPRELSKGNCRMTFVKGDIVTAKEAWKFHFVSGDFKRGAGVAKDLAAKFGPVRLDKDRYDVGVIKTQRMSTGAALINGVSKRRFFHRMSRNPEKFLADIVTLFASLREYCLAKDITRLAMVRVGAGLDRVNWRWTQAKLLDMFADLDIELVVYLRPRRRLRVASVLQEPVPRLSDFPALLVTPEDANDDGELPAGLHGGTVADACDGSVLARRPEASCEQSARSEASANDGRSASVPPHPLVQVSPVSSHLPFDARDGAPPVLSDLTSTNLDFPLAPVADAFGETLVALEPGAIGDAVDVPAHVGRGADVLKGLQVGVDRRNPVQAWGSGAPTKVVNPEAQAEGPTSAPAAGSSKGEHVPVGDFGTRAKELDASPDGPFHLRSPMSDERAAADESALLLTSPQEREGASLAPPAVPPEQSFFECGP
jgi:hypothetical protein